MFSKITLGPYETLARDIVFSAKSIDELPQLEIIASRLFSEFCDPSGITYYPVRARFQDRNVFGMCLAGVRIVAKLDNRPFVKDWEPLIINRTGVFTGVYSRFEDCAEFATVAEMVRADDRRRRARR
jgi:hypothetical protein